jgi:aryl-alcohol dehydrogenase-like predicted oxidoreductase
MEAWERRGTERTWRVIEAVERIAESRGVPMSRVALAWVTNRPGVTSTILGARTLEQLEDNLLSADLRLTEDETAVLDKASDPAAPDYPYGELGVDQQSRVLAGG